MAYNSSLNAPTLAEQIARDAKLKGEAWNRLLDDAATQHNAFARFTSDISSGNARGVQSIFCTKRDLKAGGADTVNFSVIGSPGGPGAEGSQDLVSRLSKALMKTWGVRVGYHRDGIGYSEDQIEFLAAGRSLMATTLDLLGRKMGIHRQNRMMMRLIKAVDGNVYRPNNVASMDALVATDVLGLNDTVNAKARLQRIGGKPMMTKLGPQGSPINGYLVFGGSTAFLPLRNDDGFQLALSNGHVRGLTNANFTGELIDWQGTPFYELPETDEAWDDYIGNAMSPTAWNNVAFSTATAAGSCKLITSSTNTTSLYFQFFPGFAYKFYEDETVAADFASYYAWVCNPDGSRVFLKYTGFGNDGNTIIVSQILATAAGVSTKGSKTVGNLSLGTTPTVSSNVITPDADANVPTAFVYSDAVQAGAYIIHANANGVPIGKSYVFGSMAASFAFGRFEREMIEQDQDFGFLKAKGYKEIFGTGVIKNPLGKPVGYLLVEHAIAHEGYPVPSVG